PGTGRDGPFKRVLAIDGLVVAQKRRVAVHAGLADAQPQVVGQLTPAVSQPTRQTLRPDLVEEALLLIRQILEVLGWLDRVADVRVGRIERADVADGALDLLGAEGDELSANLAFIANQDLVDNTVEPCRNKGVL